MAVHTVVGEMARAFFAFARSQGASSRELTDGTGFDPDETASDDRVPLDTYLKLVEVARTLTSRPELALLFGEEVGLDQITPLGSLASSSGTAAASLRQLNRFSAVLLDAGGDSSLDRLSCWRDSQGFWLGVQAEPPLDHPWLVESSLARLASGFARVFPDGPLAQKVHLSHADPGYRREYRRVFGAPVSFGAGRNALRIDESVMARQLPTSNVLLSSLLEQHVSQELAHVQAARSVRGSVEALLERRLSTGEAGVRAVAAALGMSRQTLHRRLRAERVTFTEVLDQLRRRRARALLDEGFTVQQVSARLGFSEPSAFSRAYRRWTGHSPRDDRLRRHDRPDRQV